MIQYSILLLSIVIWPWASGFIRQIARFTCSNENSFGKNYVSQRKETTLWNNRHNGEVDVTTSQVFSLDSIRSTLVRQEETIIFALIERAQYRRNRVIYDAKDYGSTGELNANGVPISFMEYMLMETEKLHSKVRRYTSPEEHPFYPSLLPSPILPELNYPKLLVSEKGAVDVNSDLMSWYVDKIVNRLCLAGDDEQHGSSVLCDIAAMQALSRRVHYGKFVAESKFLADPLLYTRLVRAGDVVAILELLTNVEVERRVLRRAFVKASTYGQDITGTTEGYKVEPVLIADIYRDMIIPLTKDVEVRYLFRRCGESPPPPSEYFERCRGPLDAFDDPSALNELRVPTSDKGRLEKELSATRNEWDNPRWEA